MTIKNGWIRLWVVASVVWMIGCTIVTRLDKEVPNLMLLSNQEQETVKEVFQDIRAKVSSDREAEEQLLSSIIWGGDARAFKIQHASREQVKTVLPVLLLPIFLVPIALILSWKSILWIRSGFDKSAS